MINKLLLINILISIILMTALPPAKAQVFDDSQNPPRLKWRQINTVNFQILYPLELQDEAMRVANTVERLVLAVSESLGRRPRKITLILQNQGVVSNGFVQLAPRRSEFFTTPPQNFDMQDWLNSLAIHELRHVVQFDKLTGKLKAPFFEELALAIFGVTLPPWFFEGDAVGIETALTSAGRGRLPEWEMIFRTNTLSGKGYSYSKNYLGSLKDLTPGYYQLGYFMTTKLRRDYGKFILDSLMNRMGRNPLRPYNLSQSIKDFTGLTSRTLHDSTVAEAGRLWAAQDTVNTSRSYPVFNRRQGKVPVDFLFPVTHSSGKLIVLRKGLDKTPAITFIDSLGTEIEIIRIGHQTESNFNHSSGLLVWDELRYDARYQKRSFNVVNTYHLGTGRYKQLSHESRLFSPALNPTAETIVAVRIGLDNKCQIVELDASDGRMLNDFPNEGKYILQTPSYSHDGTKIICVAINRNGAALLEIDRTDGSSRMIMPFQRQQISRPVYAGECILFRAHYNGISNIYSVNAERNISALTSVRYGASNPSYDKEHNTVLFNIFDIHGFNVGSVPFNEKLQPSEAVIRGSFIDYAAPLVEQESAPNLLDSIAKIDYPVKAYNEFSHLFNFHSLSPIAEKNEFNNDLNIGVKLRSSNQLNTLEFYTGYQFNYGLKKSEYLAGFTYKRFYPIVDVKFINRARLSYAPRIVNGLTTYTPFSWRENFVETGIRLPFISNRLNKTIALGVAALTSYTSRYQLRYKPAGFIEKINLPLEYQFYMNHNVQRSARDIAPRWGQNISVGYQHIPFGGKVRGDLFRFQSSFFLPGLFTNHSLQASFNYQDARGLYQFNVDIPRVSGYGSLQPKAVRNTLLLDYRLPLFYPDAELGPIAYIKRIRAGLFGDYQNIGKGNPFRPRTFGLELTGDMNILRFYLPEVSVSAKLVFLNEEVPVSSAVEFGLQYSF